MEQDGIRWTHRACGAALLACSKAGQLDDALQLIGKMTKHSVRPDRISYLDLISHCVRDERSEDMAMTLLQLMRDTGLAPDVRHFNAALKVCARERNPVNASTIFQQMATQIIMTSHAWNTLLDAIGRAGQVDPMLAKYREMCTGGQQPDMFTVTTLLAHAAAAGRCSIAQDIWREMHDDLQLEPDARSYNARINCMQRQRSRRRRRQCLPKCANLLMSSRMLLPSTGAYSISNVLHANTSQRRLVSEYQVMTWSSAQMGLQRVPRKCSGHLIRSSSCTALTGR
ncbi:hypothetical protein JKP88DRAFT_181843 [Tribonema minus]|uniref:Pentacotripeptide-repeat region of PRORP domain-containing protein n=1 Tax=Tribonema minus TaxID=303371 RepID=A0A836CFJ5_9STRA|nr:hypothetical protein JKP88DRAFT_181843 [Tribonema minus]